ncbi:hypothetical protein N7481_011397 [Penicillium waksmanii]|uniref:uncharacterized protein n=1 Tax=Penicillium waksmanii TaxID=69791 RepID=UPI002547661C|nr:uncharacterized protein N7481_011397 [Penicillium waksmanii]KAJ5974187.1 hypothetical protein N7481_011397 [Penicillium waksmanii]
MASVSDEPKPSTGGECFRPKRIILREEDSENEQSNMAEPAGKRPGERVPSYPSLGVALSSGVFPCDPAPFQSIWILFDPHLRIWGLLEF